METLIIALLTSAAIVLIVATILPMVRHDQWWIRVFDFPRWQVAVMGGLVVAVILSVRRSVPLASDVAAWVLVACVVLQVSKIFPYTGLYRKQVLRASLVRDDSRIAVLVANVLMTNRNSAVATATGSCVSHKRFYAARYEAVTRFRFGSFPNIRCPAIQHPWASPTG